MKVERGLIYIYIYIYIIPNFFKFLINVSIFFRRQQHQTQVAMAVDRAKQITMAELNAVMQVSVR